MSNDLLVIEKRTSSTRISPIETNLLSKVLTSEQEAQHKLAKKVDDLTKASDEALQAAVLAAAPIPPAKITPPTEEAAEIAGIAASADVTGNPLPLDNLFSTEKYVEKPPKPSAKEILANAPNAGWELILLGLGKLNQLEDDLEEISEKMEEIEKRLESLAHLSAKIAALPADQKKHVLTAEIKADLNTLKELGVDLLAVDGEEISAEKLAALKTQVDSLKSQFQSKVQKEVITMQPKTQQYNSMIDTLKRIIDTLNRLYGSISRNMAGR